MNPLGTLRAGGRIGLGLAAIGRPAYITLGRELDLGPDRTVTELERRAHQLLDSARASGVRYFDVARSYGFAEAFLASWLDSRGIPGGELTIGSKWGYTYTGGWRLDATVHESKDLSAPTFRRQLAETRELLGDRFDLYQIHSATLESGVFDDGPLLRDLTALRGSGVALGISVTGPGQAATIERALRTGIFDTVQATWNLLERSAEPALRRAHAAGVGVIVKEALANGRLTTRGGVPALIEYAQDRGVEPDAVALAAALEQPWADVVLSGAVSPQMLGSNLRAVEVAGHPAADLSGIQLDSADYWDRRSRLAWN